MGLEELERDIVDVRVRARDISTETIEREHRPLIRRAVGSAIRLVRKYVPSALNPVRNYFSNRIVYDLESHPEEPHIGGFFVPSTDKLVANTYQLGRNTLFFVETLYHEGRHALRKALGSMERLYNGFIKEVGPFWASILYPMYEEGATSRLTQMELGRTLDGYAPYRAGAIEVEKDLGVKALIYNTEDDALKIIPRFLRGLRRYFSSRSTSHAYVAA